MNVETHIWRLDEWVRHNEAIFEASPEPPNITLQDEHIYVVLLLEDPKTRETIKSQFEEYLLRSAEPLLARFATLRFYWEQIGLLEQKRPDDEWVAEEDEQIVDDLRRDFEYFLSLPPEATDIQDLDVLKWELTQAYLTRQWERLCRMCVRLRELKNLPTAYEGYWIGRLLWAGAILPFLFHKTVTYVLDDHISKWDCFFLSPLLNELPDVLPQCSEKDRMWIKHAVRQLEDALELRGNVDPVYYGIYGDCLAAIGKYKAAAEVWKEHAASIIQRECELLDCDIEKAKLHNGAGIGIFRAECHEAAGETENAIELLEQVLERVPTAKGVNLRLAELYVKQVRYEDAQGALAREREIDPDNEVWKEYKANLASSLTYVPTSSAKIEYETSDSQAIQLALIEKLVPAHWITYNKLDDVCVGKWRLGCFWLFGQHNEEVWPGRVRVGYAATEFAQVVELTLRKHIFQGFKDQQVNKLNNESATHISSQLNKLFSFVKYDDYNLSLGDMLTYMKMAVPGSQNVWLSDLNVVIDFVVGDRARTLRSERYDRIAKIRNSNLHLAHIDEGEEWEIFHLCLQFLTLLLAKADPSRKH